MTRNEENAMPMLADSHCHLNDPAFTNDRDAVIVRAKEAGLARVLNVGYNLATSRGAIALAEIHDWMYASVGLHPNQAGEYSDAMMDAFRELASHPKVVAIGETGLDYYRDRAPRDMQARSLRAHLRLAKEVGKPVIIHCRDAMADCLAILGEEGADRGVMHCFGGSLSDARAALAMGFYISFAGNITFPKANELRAALAATPGHRLLIETDAPYLAPQKVRGKQNEPMYLRQIAEAAAAARKVRFEDVARISVANFDALFGTGSGGDGEVAYRIRNSLYLNVTKECDNECGFCARFYSDTVQGHNLRIARDPTAEEMIAAVGDPARYDEIVFCGYGEPALRLDRVLEVARWIKEHGGKTRLNTNGHGSRIAGRDITPDLAGLMDHVSVSLNAPDAATYDRLCQPTIIGAFEAVVSFIRAAKARGLRVTATVVAIPGEVDVEACRRLAEDDLGVALRVRGHHLVG